MNKEIARTLIVIPTYNEASNISKLLERIFKLNVPNLDVLFVDDNSPDNTAGLIEDIQKDNPHVFLIKRSGKMGLGTAYVAGFGYALEHKYDFIFEMDADLSHNPEDIPLFLEQIDDYDLVIGSRYLTGMNVANWPLSRLFLSLFANWYTRIITGMPFKDCTSGFKCFRRHVLESIGIDQIHSDGYSFQIELHYLAWKKAFVLKKCLLYSLIAKVAAARCRAKS